MLANIQLDKSSNIALIVFVFLSLFLIAICHAQSISEKKYNIGVSLCAKGEFLAAKEAFQQCLEVDQNETTCVNGLAVIEDVFINKIDKTTAIYLCNGVSNMIEEKFDYAIAQYNKAISSNSNYKICYNERGLAYYAKGDYDKAITDFNKSIEISPSFSNPYLNRGNSFALKGDYNFAILDYDKAIKLNPILVEAYIARGSVLSEMKQYDRALSNYDKAIEINPKSPIAYYNRGNTLFLGKQQYIKALENFTNAIKLNPDFALAYHNRGAAYILLKKRKNACSDWRYACELGECGYYQKAKNVWKCCK